MKIKEFNEFMSFLGFSEPKNDFGRSCYSLGENLLIEIENYNKTTEDISGFSVWIYAEHFKSQNWIKGKNNYLKLAFYILKNLSTENLPIKQASEKFGIYINYNSKLEELKKLSPVDFCRKTGQDKAIKQNCSTRQKKRFLAKFEEVLKTLDLLGFDWLK